MKQYFSLLQELRNKGALDGLVVVFIYARVIKLTWLPLMLSYFGISFTIILSFYTVLGALIQGVIVNRLK